jgi:hypothetical protein
MTHRCDPCELDFKTKKCYQRHLKSSERHKVRTSDSYTPPLNIIRCICTKAFAHRQSLYNHHKVCEKYLKCKIDGVCCQYIPPPPVTEATPIATPTIDSIQQKLEKEISNQQRIIESFHQKMELYEKESLDQSRKIEVLQHKVEVYAQCVITEKSRDKRQKISKEMRQYIANKQKNTCGKCKLGLSLHFQIDHIIGLQFGGTNAESNLMALCCECHAIKSVAENRCRKKIQDAIQTILSES